MKYEEKAERQLAVIKTELLNLFGDYCARSSDAGIAELMQAFGDRRLELVFTVKASADETCFFCGFTKPGEEPQEMQALFTVYSPATSPLATRAVH